MTGACHKKNAEKMPKKGRQRAYGEAGGAWRGADNVAERKEGASSGKTDGIWIGERERLDPDRRKQIYEIMVEENEDERIRTPCWIQEKLTAEERDYWWRLTHGLISTKNR